MLAPCALGAVLDAESVPALRCRAIAGAANNQLASEAVAQQLIEREILWAPDFVANAGGILNISVELEPEGYAPERAEGRVRAIGDTLRDDLRRRRRGRLDAAGRRYGAGVPPSRPRPAPLRLQLLSVRPQRDRRRRPQRGRRVVPHGVEQLVLVA